LILHVDPHAPRWVVDAATAILFLHIGGGSVGIVSGAVALLARKGERLHRVAGSAFFVSMLTMSAIGATVAPFLSDRVSSVAGVMTFYLVATAWMTVKRKEGTMGRFEIGGFFVALGVAVAGIVFIRMAAHSPTGTVDNQPPQAFYIFMMVGTIAATSDLKLVLRGGISGAARIARHLWRMCFALFVAAGSFFLGQQQLFPAPLRNSPVLFVPELAVLGLTVFWLLRVRLANALRRGTGASKMKFIRQQSVQQ